VSPLAIAFSLASVLVCHGHFEGRRVHRRPYGGTIESPAGEAVIS
jgi:hypothetical protein